MKNVSIPLKAYDDDAEFLGHARIRYCPGEPGGPVWSVENLPEGVASLTGDTDLLSDMVEIEIDHALPLDLDEAIPQKSGKELFLDGVAQALNVVETLGPGREVSLMKTKLEEAVLWAGAYEAAMLAEGGCQGDCCSPSVESTSVDDLVKAPTEGVPYEDFDPYGDEFDPDDFDLEFVECANPECWCQDDVAPEVPLFEQPESLWCSREAYMAGCDCDRCLAEDVRDEEEFLAEADEHLCDEYCY